ncbi:conjugal transfer protein TrbE [Facilibium subflavum]|uniref:conjugal transfer protein TrbE n=1 Tax=Facilibium subflavum TaxID=2219058 RepID=UPI000E648661|nr:conjugal transfer protein TrbE [Facilibium subflavum]
MFNIAEFRKKPDRITDLLPWAILVDKGVVLNKDGSFQKSFRFRGPDLESSTQSQLVSITARLNNTLKRLGSGWALYVEARRKTAMQYPSQNYFPDPVSWLIDAERKDLFEREGENYESEYFLTFQYLPQKETVSKISSIFVRQKKSDEQSDQGYKKLLNYFMAVVNQLYDIMQDFMYEIKPLNDEQTLTYLHNCISENPHKVVVPDNPSYLDGVLADTPLLGGLEPKLGKYYLKTISILGFPTTSVPAILDGLNHLPLQYRWVTRFLPLDKVDAEKVLKSYKRQWFAKRKGGLTILKEVMSKSESAMVDSAAVQKSNDADEALSELSDDLVSFGYYTATVTVWDEDKERVYEKQREVERVINGLGFVSVAETVNSVEAWLSSIPGQANANVRTPLMHSLNLSHLLPFSAVWAGPQYNEHLQAPPLLYARTSGNTPFRLSNHIGDVGHQMILGPTGAGKSVLLNVMAAQFLRYKNAQVFIFDKGASFFALTQGVKGHFYEVGDVGRGGLVFQPLAEIDQNSERVWAHDWILGLLENEKVEITPEVKETVWLALSNLAETPKEQRTLTGLRSFIQSKALRMALDSYVIGGPYGEILDCDEEHFSSANWQCFEMEKLMSMPNIIAPVLAYIFHVLEKRFDGRPTLMILDEAWLFLDHPIFANKIKEWLKTLRKLNVSVVFATQSVDDAVKSPLVSALNESCPSRIFLPNDRAMEPAVTQGYEALGLNLRQVQILGHAMPKRQYYFQSHKGNCLFDLGLGPVALAFCAVSQPKERQFIREVLAQHKDYEYFLKTYLHHKGLDWAFDILNKHYQEDKTGDSDAID